MDVLYKDKENHTINDIHYTDRSEAEYLQGLIEDIEMNENYPIVKNDFDRILDDVRILLK